MVANRRLLLLGATLVAVIITAIVTRSGNDTPPPPPRTRQTADRNAASPDAAAPADVNLQALRRQRTEPADAGRDPFRFRPKPAPPPAPSQAPPVRTFKPPDAQTDPSASNTPAGPPPPPPIALKFIGLMQKADGVRIAVLTDGKRPIYGREGDDVEGRYRIMKIGDESIDIAYIDGRGRRTIALTGK